LRFSRPIVWTYTPFAEHFLGQLGERLVCYDVVDDYPALPHYQRLRPGVAEADDRLLRRADLVFFASEKLYEARRDRNPHSHLLGNAADIELFASAQTSSPPRPSDLTDIKDPIVAFHGAITSYKLDLALIRDLVLKRPDWSFVFIGPVLDETSSTALRDLPNLYLLGSKAQHELPAYLAHASVSIIPYQQNPYTEGINALKLYECLATGNPVVATDLPCFQGFGDMVLLAVGVDSFVEAINRALTDQRDELRAARLAAARPYSWDRKIERMMGFIVARLDSAS
jgi:glycosyltransferase involved in cell wall biosynthesis